MDTGTIIGLIALAVSILGTMLSFFYTRRRTKIMEEQLKIVREQAERKKTFEEASKSIRQAISIIKRYTDDPDYFVFAPLDLSKDDILGYMHDNKVKTLKLHIKPQSLTVISLDGEHLVNIKTFGDLIETIKSRVESRGYDAGFFEFTCDPNILQNEGIDLVDALHAIKELYRAHGIMESYANLIDAFDSTILNDLKQTIEALLKLIFKSLMSEHEIIFSSTDKSAKILLKLQNEICSLGSIQKFLRKLSDEICDRRLSAIQKEIFLKI